MVEKIKEAFSGIAEIDSIVMEGKVVRIYINKEVHDEELINRLLDIEWKLAERGLLFCYIPSFIKEFIDGPERDHRID